MKRIRILIFLISIFFAATSCSDKIEAKFEISNNSNEKLDSVNIKSFDNSLSDKYIKIGVGETKTYFFDMSDLPKTDGSYLLSFKRGESENVESERFGYYTNGYPTEKLTKIQIEKDTVIFEFISSDY